MFGGVSREVGADRPVTAPTALAGLRVLPTWRTPCSSIAGLAENRAACSDVVPVLCGPMCSKRVPSGSSKPA